MKKFNLLFLTILLTIPFRVNAATPSVKTLEVESTGSTIKYNGTMEDGSTAVMCKLYDTSDTEIDLFSSAVDTNAFSGSFTNVADGTYDIACANYEGGQLKKVKVTVENNENNTTDNTDSTIDNPKTYDAGIRNSIILLTISTMAIISYTIYSKKTIKNKENR